jgi:hypothetical protein
MGVREKGAVGDTGAKGMIVRQLEQGLALLDRLQQQGHLVATGSEVRASLLDLLVWLRNSRPN